MSKIKLWKNKQDLRNFKKKQDKSAKKCSDYIHSLETLSVEFINFESLRISLSIGVISCSTNNFDTEMSYLVVIRPITPVVSGSSLIHALKFIFVNKNNYFTIYLHWNIFLF